MREPDDPQVGRHDRRVQEPPEKEDDGCRRRLEWEMRISKARSKEKPRVDDAVSGRPHLPSVKNGVVQVDLDTGISRWRMGRREVLLGPARRRGGRGKENGGADEGWNRMQ